jgi:hypothetical protein
MYPFLAIDLGVERSFSSSALPNFRERMFRALS